MRQIVLLCASCQPRGRIKYTPLRRRIIPRGCSNESLKTGPRARRCPSRRRATMSEFPGPLPLQVMMNRQWNDAFNFLYTVTAAEKDSSIDGWLTRTKASDDHAVTRRMINDLIDRLFERK